MEKPIKKTAITLLKDEDVKRRFAEILGKRASSFLTSVLQIVSNNQMLASADPNSIYQSAMVAATLDLPVNNNLGFCYILPYNQKQQDGTYKQVAQFQLGYKGFIQLAQRSGQFLKISATKIYEGQLIDNNPLTGQVFDFSKKESDKVIGYASYFKLVNGFENTLYMTVDELKGHGVKFSQTFKKGFGLWKDDFDSMAIKTVLKLALSKYAPLSIDMQKAVISDQSLIIDADTNEVEYVDNIEIVEDPKKVSEQKERERLNEFINKAKSIKELSEVEGLPLTEEQIELITIKKKELNAK